jgi:hypothetical protein
LAELTFATKYVTVELPVAVPPVELVIAIFDTGIVPTKSKPEPAFVIVNAILPPVEFVVKVTVALVVTDLTVMISLLLYPRAVPPDKEILSKRVRLIILFEPLPVPPVTAVFALNV